MAFWGPNNDQLRRFTEFLVVHVLVRSFFKDDVSAEAQWGTALTSGISAIASAWHMLLLQQGHGRVNPSAPPVVNRSDMQGK